MVLRLRRADGLAWPQSIHNVGPSTCTSAAASALPTPFQDLMPVFIQHFRWVYNALCRGDDAALSLLLPSPSFSPWHKLADCNTTVPGAPRTVRHQWR